MADETLVFRDRSGAYYELTRTVLDAARVPEDRVAELEADLEPEVTGHAALPPDLLELQLIGPLRQRHHADFVHHDT